MPRPRLEPALSLQTDDVDAKFETIDSSEDPRLEDYVGLTDPDIRRRFADRPFFIAEGIEVVRRLVASDVEVRSIVVAPNRLDAMREVVSKVTCPVYVAERTVVSQIVGFDLHRGVIASAWRPPSVSFADVMARSPRRGAVHRFAVLHGIGDHENIGAIVRSARAFSYDALVLDPTCADPYYRRSVRVSMGEIFHLPVVTMPVDEAIRSIRAHGGTSVALTPRSDAVPLGELAQPRGPLGVILGSEGFGLPDEILQAADVRARIVIDPDVDSLNVGHAAAVAFACLGPEW